jgi:preprotein translocase subunit SecA
MMSRFQEDTARFLFLMQIIGPDGRPIEIRRSSGTSGPADTQSIGAPRQPAPALGRGGAAVRPEPAGGVAIAEPPIAPSSVERPVAPAHPVPIPTRQPQTTIDQIEAEFQRKKKRELEQARAAGASNGTTQTVQRRTGDKVGRNDPCPCGSGKKYKKCHGTEG